MFGKLRRSLRKISRRQYKDIAPDEVFLDSKNLPEFDTHHFEGRLEKPISSKVFKLSTIGVFVIFVLFLMKLYSFQIVYGNDYRERSINNSLERSFILAPRGIVYSRNGEKIIWNQASSSPEVLPLRQYRNEPGFGLISGFLKYPTKDSNGFYVDNDFVPKDGVELYFNNILMGKNGLKLSEVSVNGSVISEDIVDEPINGNDLVISIDSRVQNKLHEEIASLSGRVGFQAGAGIIMDVNSGEILAMTSFPEYDSKIMTDGQDKEAIDAYIANQFNPFLNRNTSGLYTPGSIVKPFLAFAALEEEVITPEKEIVSTGRLVVPNPYDPENPTIFRDWKAHGATDMRHAIAVSSDVYFYQIGGGFQGQKGLGVERIKKYLENFGFTRDTGFGFGEEALGVIPSPEWKEKNFEGEIWRVGDTYNTSIGQYGMQVTPIQVVRAVAALANGGHLISPSIIFTSTSTVVSGEKVDGKEESFRVVKEGMRLAVTEGTALGLNTKDVEIAGKTGTAELGARKQFVNSWTVGFFPYENPKYAYAVVMERGPVANLVGATSVMRAVVDWMAVNTPEYLKNE